MMNENRLTLPLARPGIRFQGQFIDGLISLLLLFISFKVLRLFTLSESVFNVVVWILPAVYFVFCDALPKGQSIAKRILNISVIDEKTGSYCSVWQSFSRNVFTPIMGVLDWIFILGKKRRRIGDYLAGTIVIDNSNDS